MAGLRFCLPELLYKNVNYLLELLRKYKLCTPDETFASNPLNGNIALSISFYIRLNKCISCIYKGQFEIPVKRALPPFPPPPPEHLNGLIAGGTAAPTFISRTLIRFFKGPLSGEIVFFFKTVKLNCCSFTDSFAFNIFSFHNNVNISCFACFYGNE